MKLKPLLAFIASALLSTQFASAGDICINERCYSCPGSMSFSNGAPLCDGVNVTDWKPKKKKQLAANCELHEDADKRSFTIASELPAVANGKSVRAIGYWTPDDTGQWLYLELFNGYNISTLSLKITPQDTGRQLTLTTTGGWVKCTITHN